MTQLFRLAEQFYIQLENRYKYIIGSGWKSVENGKIRNESRNSLIVTALSMDTLPNRGLLSYIHRQEQFMDYLESIYTVPMGSC